MNKKATVHSMGMFSYIELKVKSALLDVDLYLGLES